MFELILKIALISASAFNLLWCVIAVEENEEIQSYTNR